MDPEDNYRRDIQTRGRTRRFGKRVLAVRAMAGETAWLDGRIIWHEGRVFWESQGRLFAPIAADLSLAQRRLNQIRRYPVAGEQALGDLSAWLARRWGRLELAKRLYSVRVPDSVSSGLQVRGPDASSIMRLSALLLAESVCANTLPVSAARTLAAYGERAQPALCAVLNDRSIPGIARALAALTLGAAHKQIAQAGNASKCILPVAVQESEWTQRAYSWGLRSGMPSEPTLYIKLLSDGDGASLVRRYEVAAQLGSPFQLDTNLLHDLLGAGAPPKKVVSLTESLLALVPLSKLVLNYRDLLPDRPAKKRHETAERLQTERHAHLASLGEMLRAYIRSTSDPGVVEAFAQLAYMVLELGEPVEQSLNHLLIVLSKGLSLPAHLQRSYLELLIEHREQMWDKGCHEANPKNFDWLLHCQAEHIEPLLALLDTTKNPEIVREAVQVGIYLVLSDFRWGELDRYRWMLSLARDLDLRQEPYLARRLCHVVGNFTGMPAAHLVLQSIMRPLMRLDTDHRRQLSSVMFYELPYSRQGQRQALSKLMPHFPRLVDFAAEDEERVRLLVGLVQYILSPAGSSVEEKQGAFRLDWMLLYLAERAEKLEHSYADLPWLVAPAVIAHALAAGDFAHYQVVFRAAIEHDLDYDWERLEAGIRVLGGFSHLPTVLAGTFARQPHRCVKLIEQIGLLPRLGKQALVTLASLEPSARGAEALQPGLEPIVLADEWQALLAAVPELLPDVLSYLRAQQVLGGGDRLPPGLRRIMDQPAKWASELTHLQALLKHRPERADLAKREGNLRSRLADSVAGLRTMRQELVESLRQLVAEAELAAVERHVTACYHEYLEGITGMEPVEIELNEDLLNAALLMTDIKSNRQLLLKLLRGYLGGQRRWPEQHPRNIEYLEKLRAQGVNVVSWLRSHPRVYRCKGKAVERLHLRLERDPLSILQMGNHFSTCLRFGGINAFSTVANACELNKRVIYARDSKGKVVGRKLVGISEEGKLVGFQTYISLDEGAGGKELRTLFNRYAADFARRCELELADEGTVPRLFAQSWYDDGAVAWAGEEQAVGSGHKSHKGDNAKKPAPELVRAQQDVTSLAKV